MSPKPKLLLLGFLLFLLTTSLFASDLPPIEAVTFELPNGLDVILYQDSSLPTAAVNIWYHVGSKNEKAGRTGFAHLFEHLMFAGSGHSPEIYDEPIQKIGARNNGSTSEDRTNFYESLPSNYLERILWLESDRMGHLTEAIDQQKLDIQRDVVKNERRQSLDNQPYAKEYELMLEMMFPPSHPYHHSVIGHMDDLTAANLEDVYEFFKLYYTPNNASLTIVGDFDLEQTKEWVEKYFAYIPPSEPIERIAPVVPVLDREYRTIVEDQITLPMLTIDWHTPGYYQPGDAEFDIVGDILAGGKNSRLYKKLVYELQIAQQVTAYQSSMQLSSTFEIQILGKPDTDLNEIEAIVDNVIADMLENGVTEEEVDRSRVNIQAGIVRRLQSNNGRANKFNTYLFYTGEPNNFRWDYDRYTNATPESVTEYARTYLTDKRGVVQVVPAGTLGDKGETIDKNEQEMAELAIATPEDPSKFANVQLGEMPENRADLPEGAAEPTFTPPPIQEAVLDNGSRLLLVEDHRLPLVQVQLVLLSGWAADPTKKPGTAALTSALLDEGNETMSSLEINGAFQSIGANFSTGSTFDNSYLALNVLKGKLDDGLDLMADVLLKPTFPEEELARIKKEYLGRIEKEKSQPLPTALKTFGQVLMGKDHPYGQPYTGSGREESITAITRKDLVKFHKKNFVANNATFVVVGDMTLDEATTALNGKFGDWKKGKVKAMKFPAPAASEQTAIYIVDKPDAAQSALVLGNIAFPASDEHAIAAEVMNTPFGGEFMSRINMNLREDKAYTYGAHSFFWDFRNAGMFVVYSEVGSDVTKEALTEFFNEFKDITGEKPLSKVELADARSTIIKSYPQDFSDVGSIAQSIAKMVSGNVPLDEWNTYVQRIETLTDDEIQQAAKNYIRPDKMVVIVVGDRAKIEEGLRELGYGDVIIIEP